MKRLFVIITVALTLLISSSVFAASEFSVQLNSKVNNAVMLCIGNSKAYANGNQTVVDSTNLAVCPIIKDDRTLVPVRFIAENMGATVGWNDLNNTVTIKLNDYIVELKIGSNELRKYAVTGDDGYYIGKIDVPAQIINERTFIPLRALAEALNKEVFWDDRGLIVISDVENIFDAVKDKELIDEIASAFTQIRINNYHPIVFAYGGDYPIDSVGLIGGSSNGIWVDYMDLNLICDGKETSVFKYLSEWNYENRNKEIEIPMAKGDESFKFYSFDKFIAQTSGIGKLPTIDIVPASGQDDISIKIKPFNAKEGLVLGINCDWNPMPDIPVVIEDQNAYALDIDGDGKDETIKIVDKTVNMLNGYHYMDMIKKSIIIQDGSSSIVKDIIMYPEDAQNLDILFLDLNGDGKLEIITHVSSVAGFLSIDEIVGGKVNRVFGIDLGE